MNQNVFSGSSSIREYLNPENQPPVPLVELPDSLNPDRARDVRVFVKLMHQQPLGNVKAYAAYGMIDAAAREGRLADVSTLFEASSGNTVMSLAVLGRAFGINRTVALASNQVSPGKLQLLRVLGTEVRVFQEDICPDPADPMSAINQAKRLGGAPNCLNLGQYHNPANPEAHARWTGPQIWAQTEGKITVFVAGLGTTGTVCGAGGFLKAQNSSVRVLGIVREPNNPVPGVRTENLLNAVGFDWEKVADRVTAVGTRDAYATSLELCREGLLVGPSSGFALAGLRTHLASLSPAELDGLRNADGEVVAVVIAPDGVHPYVEDYFKFLGADYFPPIENEDLLLERRDPEASPNFATSDVDLTPAQCLATVYGSSRSALAEACESGAEVTLRPPHMLIDLRTEREFIDHHLPGSDRTDYEIVLEGLENSFVPAFRRSGIRPVFVCAYGGKSSAIARKVKALGVDARNLQGGTQEWSRLGFPRVRNAMCPC